MMARSWMASSHRLLREGLLQQFQRLLEVFRPAVQSAEQRTGRRGEVRRAELLAVRIQLDCLSICGPRVVGLSGRGWDATRSSARRQQSTDRRRPEAVRQCQGRRLPGTAAPGRRRASRAAGHGRAPWGCQCR